MKTGDGGRADAFGHSPIFHFSLFIFHFSLFTFIHSMATIAVLGTLDSKGHEPAFVADVIRRRGHTPLLIDVGTLDEPQVKPDVTRQEVAAAGGVDLSALAARRGRGES